MCPRLRWIAFYCALFICLGVAVARPSDAAGTTHIREFAKNGSGVIIVISGDEATPVAQVLQTTILQSPDNKHAAQDISVLPIHQADALGLLNNRPSDKPLIFLLIRHELPSVLSPMIASSAVDPSLPASASRVVSQLTKTNSGDQFTVTLVAPDAKRLRRLLDVFLSRQSENYRDLPFSQTYFSNTIAIFSSPADKLASRKWGLVDHPDTWNAISWYPLSELPTLGPETTQMYYLDRSSSDAVPEPARLLLANQEISPNSIVAVHSSGDGAPSLVVFTAPSAALLESLTVRYPNVASLPAVPVREEAIDLRSVGRTALLVSGGTRSDRDDVQAFLVQQMRRQLRIPIDDVNAFSNGREVSITDLSDAYQSVIHSHHTPRLRNVWVLQIQDSQSETKYAVDKQRLIPPSTGFPLAEPTEPSHYNGLFGTDRKSDQQYNREMDEWRVAHARWRTDKDSYEHLQEYAAQIPWQRRLLSHSTAHISGILHLVDLADLSAASLCQANCEGGREQDTVVSSDVVMATGERTIPADLTIPADAAITPPSLVEDAERDAVTQALQTVKAQAWFQTSANTLADALTETSNPKDDTSTSNSNTNSPLVADVSLGVVTLTIGASDGVAVGDKVLVPIRLKQIVHPVTGVVLESKALDTIKLRVVRVGKLAECEPATPLDAKKIAQVKVGSAVQWMRQK